MEGTKLQELEIDECIIRLAFDRDIDFHDKKPQSAFLDRQTGEIIWFYEDDFGAEMDAGISAEDNQATQQLIEAEPERYLGIPGLSHGDHHDILKEFLGSNWTDNDGMRKFAQDSYRSSIGGWIKSVDDDSIKHAFYDYRDRKTMEMAEAFLRSHDIKPVWK